MSSIITLFFTTLELRNCMSISVRKPSSMSPAAPARQLWRNTVSGSALEECNLIHVLPLDSIQTRHCTGTYTVNSKRRRRTEHCFSNQRQCNLPSHKNSEIASNFMSKVSYELRPLSSLLMDTRNEESQNNFLGRGLICAGRRGRIRTLLWIFLMYFISRYILMLNFLSFFLT